MPIITGMIGTTIAGIIYVANGIPSEMITITIDRVRSASAERILQTDEHGTPSIRG